MEVLGFGSPSLAKVKRPGAGLCALCSNVTWCSHVAQSYVLHFSPQLHRVPAPRDNEKIAPLEWSDLCVLSKCPLEERSAESPAGVLARAGLSRRPGAPLHLRNALLIMKSSRRVGRKVIPHRKHFLTVHRQFVALKPLSFRGSVGQRHHEDRPPMTLHILALTPHLACGTAGRRPSPTRQ
jgi:hypothetical protein